MSESQRDRSNDIDAYAWDKKKMQVGKGSFEANLFFHLNSIVVGLCGEVGRILNWE